MEDQILLVIEHVSASESWARLWPKCLQLSCSQPSKPEHRGGIVPQLDTVACPLSAHTELTVLGC